jgi:AbrB family looped-hinge helix DNA binding protein
MLAVVGDLKAVFTSWHESAANASKIPTRIAEYRLMRITSKGQVTIPQEIREQCGLLPHTQVRFLVEDGRVLIEKEPAEGSPGSEGLQRLRRARLRPRLSTDELLALTRGQEQP